MGVRAKRKEPLLKRTGYKLSYKMFQRLASIDAPADARGFSLIDCKVLEVISQLPERNRCFRSLRAWSGFRRAGVTYERQPRAAEDSRAGLSIAFNAHSCSRGSRQQLLRTRLIPRQRSLARFRYA
jgi:hypothetical protein